MPDIGVVFLLSIFSIVATTATVVHEVPSGSLAILPCPSNEDTQHRFQYWQIKDGDVIGPGNPYNGNKYHYEVWSGRLFIKSVSSHEAGIYKCISKHISHSGLNIQGVELIVTKDWEEVYETDSEANAYRAVIAVLVLFILILLGVFAYFIKTRRPRNFNNLQREESPDEGPSARGAPQRAYNPTTKAISPQNRPPSRALDNAVVETDIKTSFSLTDYP